MGPRRGYAAGPLDKGTLRRALKYVFRDYGFRILIVAILIAVNSFAHLRGTLFMADLIDKYILQECIYK